MNDLLRILVAGCGSIGHRHIRILIRSLGNNNVLIYDDDVGKAQKIKDEFPEVTIADSFEAGIKLADIVFILTPTKWHIPMATEALRAGCHVFIEKPISTDTKGVSDLEKLAVEKNKKVMVGLCFRYHEGILKLKRVADSGRVGRIISIRALMGEHFPAIHPNYQSMYYAKYSGAFELMHDLDLAIWFANQKVTHVSAAFGSFSDIGIRAPDTVEFLLEFEDRCVATVHLDFFQNPRRRQLELIGSSGVAIIDFASWDEYTLSVFDADANKWEKNTFDCARDDMFIAEDQEFLEAIIYDKPILCDIKEACKSMVVIESAQTKKQPDDFFPEFTENTALCEGGNVKSDKRDCSDIS